jgi:hypothetical protein
MEERFTFGTRERDLALLEATRRSLEAFGFTCTVETTTLTRHEFVLHTLVAVPPTRPTRAERGCTL